MRTRSGLGRGDHGKLEENGKKETCRTGRGRCGPVPDARQADGHPPQSPHVERFFAQSAGRYRTMVSCQQSPATQTHGPSHRSRSAAVRHLSARPTVEPVDREHKVCTPAAALATIAVAGSAPHDLGNQIPSGSPGPDVPLEPKFARRAKQLPPITLDTCVSQRGLRYADHIATHAPRGAPPNENWENFAADALHANP